MKKEAYKIHIVGGGVSGLIAAQVLEARGYHPTLIEATDRVGGRLKTDIIDGYQLDHGFQVLLTAYPTANKYLDYQALDLQRFYSGAVLFDSGKQKTIGDPLRNPSLLFKTLVANVGSISDKLKILKLNASLKKKSVTDIFQSPEKSTLHYLKAYGFSADIIARFFKPFFSGIFLEHELATSSRMFEFVYKMFGEGDAALPKAGIEAIPKQLKGKLNQTKYLFNSKVHSVEDGKIILTDGEVLPTHCTIIATSPEKMIFNLKSQNISWKSCDTLYFEADKRVIDKPIIGLISESALINNIFYHTSVDTATNGGKELLSVTVVKEHDYNEEELIAKVSEELKTCCTIVNSRFLKHYTIPKALPDLNNLQYDLAPSESKLKDTLFLAGDHLLNGSLNAAMLSGEKAALGLIKVLEESPDLSYFISEYR